MSRKTSPLISRRLLWPLFVTLTLLLIAFVPLLPPPYRNGEVLLTAVGFIWALAFYLHGRHAEDAKFMKELLTDFNRRYTEMNEALQKAVRQNEPFSESMELQFIDYFNLCAEEWLFRKAGYIYDPVWEAWENGMKEYAKDSRVRELWLKERESNSYYGFELPVHLFKS